MPGKFTDTVIRGTGSLEKATSWRMAAGSIWPRKILMALDMSRQRFLRKWSSA